MNLSQESLAKLGGGFRTPNYAKLAPGLVHLGLGHFFRAHTTVYQEERLRAEGGGQFFTAINLRAREPVAALKAQDGYYVVAASAAGAREDRLVVGCLREALHWSDDAEVARRRLLAAELVTLTVTEKGYFAKPGTHALERRPEIVADLANPEVPATAIGILAWVCKERARQKLPGFTALSCDNLQANGEILRAVLLEYMSERFPEARAWTENEVAFPSAMVDRIVPHYDEAKLRAKEASWPLWDSQAIFTESFKQWVIEDKFHGKRPTWAAEFVSDVKPYEKMKLQLLNASHSWLAYRGLLVGLETVDQAVKHFGAELKTLMETELVPALPRLTGFDTKKYCQELLVRFQNPALEHRLRQIAMDGSQKIPQRWWPSLKNGRAPLLWLGMAAWARFVEKSLHEGTALQDPKAAAIAKHFSSGRDLWDSLQELGMLPQEVSREAFDQAKGAL